MLWKQPLESKSRCVFVRMEWVAHSSISFTRIPHSMSSEKTVQQKFDFEIGEAQPQSRRRLPDGELAKHL